MRYLVVGAVHRLDRRLRLNAGLVEAATGHALWSGHFDGSDEDLFGVQTRFAAAIAAAVDPRVEAVEIAAALKRPTSSPSAYDHLLRALAVLHRFDDGGFERTGELLRRAIELDPAYARAHARLAWWHMLKVAASRATRTAASRCDWRGARPNWTRSTRSRCRWRGSRSRSCIATSTPRSSCSSRRCRSTRAVPSPGRAAPRRWPTSGAACIATGRHVDATVWLARARRLNAGYRTARHLHVAALALAGHLDEARAQAEALLEAEPKFDVATFGERYPQQEPHRAKLLDALRRAGLPG